MNTELIIELQKQIITLQETYEEIMKIVSALQIDSQVHVKSNKPIKPNIACKISYDSKGLVTNGESLNVVDIPSLPIDKIDGLRKALSDKASRRDLKNVSVDLDMIFKRRDIIGTACKVNYDDHGLVVSSADLSVEDIPKLPISHIDGLDDLLEQIRSNSSAASVAESVPVINPGTFPKVTVDKYGHVVGGDTLGIDDIPNELIVRVNTLESKIPGLAPSSLLETIQRSLTKKVDRPNKAVTPGIYTKVKINSDGVITEGKQLDVSDLPKLRISDIDGLNGRLNELAFHSDFVELHSTVSTLMNNMNRIGDLSQLKTEVRNAASQSQISSIKSELESLRNLVSSLMDNIGTTLIVDEINSIKNEISYITGKVSVLETKI